MKTVFESQTYPMTIKKIAAYIEIIRPWWLPVLIPILLGPAYISANGPPPTLKMILAVLSFALIKCSATVFNDVFDSRIDQLIHPNRPIPSGIISRKEASLYGIMLLVLGFSIAVFVNRTFFSLAFVSSAFYLLHMWKIKKILIPGIATIGTNLSIAFIVLGGWSISSPLTPLSLFLASLVFFWDMSHDTASSIRDLRGDQSGGLQSFAVVYGNKNAARIAVGLFILVIYMSVKLSYIIQLFYLMHIIIIASIFMMKPFLRLLKDPGKENAAAVHRTISWYPIALFIYIILALS